MFVKYSETSRDTIDSGNVKLEYVIEDSELGIMCGALTINRHCYIFEDVFFAGKELSIEDLIMVMKMTENTAKYIPELENLTLLQ